MVFGIIKNWTYRKSHSTKIIATTAYYYKIIQPTVQYEQGCITVVDLSVKEIKDQKSFIYNLPPMSKLHQIIKQLFYSGRLLFLPMINDNEVAPVYAYDFYLHSSNNNVVKKKKVTEIYV